MNHPNLYLGTLPTGFRGSRFQSEIPADPVVYKVSADPESQAMLNSEWRIRQRPNWIS